MTTTDVRRRRRPTRGAVLWGVLAVAALGLGLGAWAAVEAARVRTALDATAHDLAQLQRDAGAGDLGSARALLPVAQAHAAAADAAARSLPLRVARALPPLRADVTAVATGAAAVHDLTDAALPPLLDAAEQIDPGRLLGAQGRVDIASIARVAPSVRAADDRVAAAQRRVDATDDGRLHGPVARAVRRLEDALATVHAQTSTAARAATLLPAMLGADGPRHYLVMVQNNAEFRSTGGIPGAVLLVDADQGTVTVREQRGAGALNPRAGEPVAPLTRDELALFGTQPALYEQDVNLIPDYPRSAELLARMWHSATGLAPDGVLSVDPVVLAKVLATTGPVTLADAERLTGQDAPEVLLHDIYLRTDDPAQQDAFFAATTRAVFEHLLAPGTPRTGVVGAIAVAAREGRVMLWSAHRDEQARLGGTVISGELVGHLGGSPVVGVYLDDGSGAKMSWFVDSAVAVRREGDELVTTLTLTNTAPAGGAGLPSYMTGSMLPKGDVRTNFDLYAPTGGAVRSLTVDGTPTDVLRARYRGLEVAEWAAQLAPGRSVTVQARLSVPRTLPGPPRARVTPAARGPHIAVTTMVPAS